MRTTLPSSLLLRLSEFVATQTGLHFPPERWADLERGIAAAVPDFDFSDLESCAHWLLSAVPTRQINEILASHLSIGETYFFREKRSLEILGEQILVQLLQARSLNKRRLRIWSAGCCTGEEAYTIAILLDRFIPDIKAWDITILATDFNPKFLKKAMLGIYGAWSFRDAPGWLQAHYFNQCADGRFEIHSRIRKMVTFSYLNFADDVYPSVSNNTSAMDIIFCRNVLMYFSARQAKRIADNFYRALVDGGWLIVSAVEASNALFTSFTAVEFPGAVLYRKMAGTGTQQLQEDYPVSVCFKEADATPPALPLVAIEPVTLSIVHDSSTLPVLIEQTGTVIHPHEHARSYANQGRLGEALEWCEKAIAADKMNPLHHYLSATILQEMEQHDIAIQSLIRALYLDPDFMLAHFALGNIHQSQGRYREARRYFTNVLLLIHNHQPDEILTEADGLTAGRLAEIVTSLLTSLPLQITASA